METDTIHPAEAYLRNENNPSSLYVKIEGKRRRLFINRNENVIGIIALGKRKRGYVFTNWTSIEKIYYPSQKQEADTDGKLILKYQKLARLATHTNDWLRKIAHADLEKSLYENGITTGTRIDGKCIRLSTIGKYCGMANIQLFRQAMNPLYRLPSASFCWPCRPDLSDAKVCHRVLIVRTEMYFLQILPLTERNFQERPGI